MTKEFSSDRLDVSAFAQAGAQLSGHDTLQKYPRLAHETQGAHDQPAIDWTVSGELRAETGSAGQTWLHLDVQALLPMTCQRCLTPVGIELFVDRSFRFVADEATAEALDDESEEDLLALSQEFDLHGLIEDELLMELPVVPCHDVCPSELPFASTDDDFEAANSEKPNPFAALAALKNGKAGN